MQYNVKGYQAFTDTGEALVKHVDPVSSRSYVWDTNTLDWVPATASAGGGGPSSDVYVQNWPGTQQVAGTVNVGNLNGLTDAQLRASAVPVTVSNFPTDNALTDAQLRATPIATTTESAFTFLEGMARRAVAKLTFSLTGLRVDAGGSSVAVTAVAGLGSNNANGQGIQQSQLVYQSSFRRNIT